MPLSGLILAARHRSDSSVLIRWRTIRTGVVPASRCNPLLEIGLGIPYKATNLVEARATTAVAPLFQCRCRNAQAFGDLRRGEQLVIRHSRPPHNTTCAGLRVAGTGGCEKPPRTESATRNPAGSSSRNFRPPWCPYADREPGSSRCFSGSPRASRGEDDAPGRKSTVR